MNFDLFLNSILEMIPSQIWTISILIIIFILIICLIVTFFTLKLLKRKKEIDNKFKEIPWKYTNATIFKFVNGIIDIYGNIDSSGEFSSSLKMIVRFKTEDEIIERPCKSNIKMKNLRNKKYRDGLINTTIRIQYKQIFYNGKRAFLIYNCDE